MSREKNYWSAPSLVFYEQNRMKLPAIISGVIMPIQRGSGSEPRPSCGVFRAVSCIGNQLSLAFRQKRRGRSPIINGWVVPICELEEAHWEHLYPCPPGGP